MAAAMPLLKIRSAVLALIVFTPLLAEDYGGLNIARYCADAHPGSRAVIIDQEGKETKQAKGSQRAHGWRCVDNKGQQHSVPVGQICLQTYGVNATPVADANDAYSWKCVKKSGPPDLIAEEIPGQTVRYTSYQKSTAKLNVYRGERMAILSPYKIPEADVRQIVGQADACATVYADLSVRNWPDGAVPDLQGLATIALVEKTCGAGCGAGGRAEIQVNEFRDAYRRVGNQKSPFTWQVGFYEFGRSGSSQKYPAYPFYPALDPSGGHHAIASAYPEFVMSVCFDKLGIDPAAYQKSYSTIGYPRNQHVTEHARQYWDSGLVFTEALSKDRGKYYRGWVLSGLLFDIYREFGYDTVKLLLRELATLGEKNGQVKTIGAVGVNLIKAAGVAGGDRLVNYLRQKWRIQG